MTKLMSFKDLPSFEDIEKMQDNMYLADQYITTRVFLRHADNTITNFSTLFQAYNFLRKNDHLKVRHDFFDNNFPFLRGLGKNRPYFTIRGLRIVKNVSSYVLVQDADYVIKNLEEYDKFTPNLPIDKYYVTITPNAIFIVTTYSELLERVEMLRFMSL